MLFNNCSRLYLSVDVELTHFLIFVNNRNSKGSHRFSLRKSYIIKIVQKTRSLVPRDIMFGMNILVQD